MLSIFLVNGVAAVMSYASWGVDEEQSATVINGESISFSVDFDAMNPPMNVKVELYDSSDKLIYTFLNKNINANEYTASYTINKSIYGSVGDFTVILQGKDAYSSDSYELTLKVTPDTTAPVITILGNNPVSINEGTTYTDAGATALDNLDGSLTSEITVSENVDADNAGTYFVIYSVSDEAGNTATATRTVYVVEEDEDITDPTVIISSPANGSSYNILSQSLTFTATDENLESCEYSIDNGVTRTSVDCTSGEQTYVNLTAVEGLNTWIVYAYDESENEGSASVSFTIDTTIDDTTAPNITMISPENDEEIKSRSLDVELTVDEDATVTLQLDDEEAELMNNDEDHIFTYELTGLDNGEHTLIITATDTAGNVKTQTVTFDVNKKSSKSSSTVIVDAESSDESSEGNFIGSVTVKEVQVLNEKTTEISCFQRWWNAIVEFFRCLFKCDTE